MPLKKATKSITPDSLKKLLPARNPRGHKNSFGHLLLLGGAPGRVGAVVLSARAALRTGVGLVTAATTPEAFAVLQCKLPEEAMSAQVPPLPPENHFSALAIGPGWGTGDTQSQIFQSLLQDSRYSALPWVIDADALNTVALHRTRNDWRAALQSRKAPTLLTPHPMELARLLGCSVEQVLANPEASARKISHELAAITILKGPQTWVVAPDNSPCWCLNAPNDGLAKGGSGDVLTGILGGFFATANPQDLKSAVPLAVLAVGVHSLAGKKAAQNLGRRSMIAGDIISALSSVMNQFRG